jgi:hypothetical protein
VAVRRLLILLLVAAAAAVVVGLVTPGANSGITEEDQFYRGWGINGSQPYVQVWNNGKTELCVESLTVSSDVLQAGVLMYFDPLIQVKPRPPLLSIKADDLRVFGATPPNGLPGGVGVSLDGGFSAKGELRASVGRMLYGGQLLQFRLLPYTPYTIQLDDCVAGRKGIGIRFTETSRIWFGARWRE